MAAIAAEAGGRRGVVRRVRVPTLLVSAVTLGLIGGIGVFQVLQTSAAATAGYDIRALESERDRLAAEIRLSEVTIARMARGERVRDEARTRLGMVEPASRVQVAVSVAAPEVVPLPWRYVPAVEALPPVVEPWWQQWLRRVPGFE
jgi:hypothetical protein